MNAQGFGFVVDRENGNAARSSSVAPAASFTSFASGGVVLLYFSGESQYRFAVELGVAGAFAHAPLLS